MTPTAKVTVATAKMYYNQGSVSKEAAQCEGIVWKQFQDRMGVLCFKMTHTIHSS
jgi:hypothetical protein